MTETFSQLFLHTLRIHPKDNLMSYKKAGRYIPISTEDFGNQVKWTSLALQNLGVKHGDKLILLAENGPRWIMLDLANLCLGGITVPLYNNLIPEHIRFIIDDSDATVVVCSSQALWEKVKIIKGKLNKVRHFITFQSEAKKGVLTLSRLLEKGKEIARLHPTLFEKTALKVKPNDVASIIYTSGTTGIPKGTMLTHANLLSNIKTVSGLVGLTDKDIGFSFLPLSHVFARTVNYGYLYSGSSISYAESMDTIAEDMLQVSPHVFAAIPRLFENIYTRVIDDILSSPSLKRKIFYWAVKTGKNYREKQSLKQSVFPGLRIKQFLAKKLVYSKITGRMGGRVRFCVSAAAPLAKDIAEFFHAIGLVILEGYGLTETSPALTINTPKNLKFGTVGKPIPGVQIRIAEDGEILARGPNIMKGYYKKPEWTREAIKDDWFYTGDIGHLDKDGYLVITDRKKDIIITSGGKNMAPQPTETLLKMSPLISNVVVIGDRRKFISALIVPNFSKIKEYARKNNISYQGLKDLVKNSKIIKIIEAEVEKHTRGLSAFEKIKKIALLDRDFEIDKGEITPTMKIKRNIIAQKYITLIDSLYSEANRLKPQNSI